MYNFESAIVECGQRPPVSIDTSRPAEDSRQFYNLPTSSFSLV
jgi:hypothetical protein